MNKYDKFMVLLSILFVIGALITNTILDWHQAYLLSEVSK